MMNDLYVWSKVINDLSEKHDLGNDQIKRVEQVLFHGLFQGGIPPLDKYGKVIPILLTITRGAQDVFVKVKDVNNFFFDMETIFFWKPRKKKGRPVSSSSLEVHRASGKLESDARQAAAELKKISGRDPCVGQVADRLVKNFPEYKKYKPSTIEKYLRISMWRK
jgi:hypothetical protein